MKKKSTFLVRVTCEESAQFTIKATDRIEAMKEAKKKMKNRKHIVSHMKAECKEISWENGR